MTKESPLTAMMVAPKVTTQSRLSAWFSGETLSTFSQDYATGLRCCG